MLRALPEPPARSRRCSARGALQRRSAAGCGSRQHPRPDPEGSQNRAPTTTGGSGSRGFRRERTRFPLPARAEILPRLRGAEPGAGHGGAGARGSPRSSRPPGSIPPAGAGAPRTSNTSYGCGIAAKARSPSVCSNPFLCLCLFTCLLLKIRHFSKPSVRVSSLEALAGPGVLRCGPTCSLFSAGALELLRARLGSAWVGFSFGRSEAVRLRVKQRSFCNRDHSNSLPLKRSFCWENNSNCKIVFI